jgi:hypothetical protein
LSESLMVLKELREGVGRIDGRLKIDVDVRL